VEYAAEIQGQERSVGRLTNECKTLGPGFGSLVCSFI